MLGERGGIEAAAQRGMESQKREESAVENTDTENGFLDTSETTFASKKRPSETEPHREVEKTPEAETVNDTRKLPQIQREPTRKKAIGIWARLQRRLH